MRGIKGFKAQKVILRCNQLPTIASGCPARGPAAKQVTKSRIPPFPPTPPCPLLPPHSLFGCENPILLGMCHQGPDLSHQAPAFLCTHQSGHHSRLHGKDLYGCPADLASQFQYPPKGTHKGTPGTRVTICSSLDLDTLLS